MRPTKCDHEQANRTLRSGVRAKNEGKFGLLSVTFVLTSWYITLNIYKSTRDRVWKHRT